MPGLLHNGMELLTDEDVGRIHRITDRLGLDRNWIVIPMVTSDDGKEIVMPDGKLLLRPPGAPSFGAWLRDLPERLRELPLGRIPRRASDEETGARNSDAVEGDPAPIPFPKGTAGGIGEKVDAAA